MQRRRGHRSLTTSQRFAIQHLLILQAHRDTAASWASGHFAGFAAVLISKRGFDRCCWSSIRSICHESIPRISFISSAKESRVFISKSSNRRPRSQSRWNGRSFALPFELVNVVQTERSRLTVSSLPPPKGTGDLVRYDVSFFWR